MTFRRKPLTVLWITWIVLMGTGCTHQEGNIAPAAKASQKPDSDQVVLDPAALREGRIVLSDVKQDRLPEVLRVTGRIGVNENQTARVGAITQGRVVRVLANVGDFVQLGQPLAEMHSHEVHDIRAELTKARAEMDRRRSDLQYASTARDRTARLHTLKAASLEQLQRSEADVIVAEQAVVSAQAEIDRILEHLHYLGVSMEPDLPARPVVAGSREPSERIPVVSPLAGTVLKRMVTPGAVVTASSDLFEIGNLGTLWVNAEVHEKYLSSLKAGLPVEVSVQAYPEDSFPGRLTYVGETLDPTTRTAQLRCETGNPERKLKPEMYATITINLGHAVEVPLIQTSAITDVDGESVVFVHQSDGSFRVRRIKPGRQTGSLTEVLQGLRSGEKVASTGSFLLKSELLKSRMAEE
jgi:membrane fusion protein, heavy metal efflux system